MSKLKPNFYRLTGLSKTNTYIETGTYYGLNLEEVVEEYKQIYTIEIEKKWVEYNEEKFEDKNNIQIIEGDSSVKLPELCSEIEEGVTFFLDAHYSGEGTGYKEKTSPIIKELESIFYRKNNKDIILINNLRIFNERSFNKNNYKKAVLDWTLIPLENIKKTIPKDWKILYNHNNSLSFGKVDQLIVCNVSSLNMIFIKIYQFCVFIVNRTMNLIKTKQTNLRKVIRHYFFYFVKILLSDKVYKKIKDFLKKKS